MQDLYISGYKITIKVDLNCIISEVIGDGVGILPVTKENRYK